MVELIRKTNKEILEYFVDYLKSQKIKEKDIRIEGEVSLFFVYGQIEYMIYVEDFETIHYGVYEIDDVPIGSDFWSIRDEFGDYTYIDEFFEGIVKEKFHLDVQKIWKSFENLQQKYEPDLVEEIANRFFNI